MIGAPEVGWRGRFGWVAALALGAVLLLLLLLLLALWRLRAGPEPVTGSQAAAGATGRVASAGAAAAPMAAGIAHQAMAREGLVASAASAVGPLAVDAGSPIRPPAKPVETVLPGIGPVCGLTPAQAGTAASEENRAAKGPALLPPAIGRVPLRQAWRRMHQRLLASAEPAQRVAGWLLGPEPPELYGAEPATAGPAVRPEPLLALLAGSDDPLALNFGVQLCSLPGQAPLCDPGALARRWLRAAPDNIVPWLALAQAEPGAIDEALAGAARARRWDDGHGRLVAFALGAWPGDAPPYLLTDASMLWLMVEAHLAGRGYSVMALGGACRGARAAGDLTRQGWCEAIARQAVTQTPHGLGRLEGSGLGVLLGWPEDELARLRAPLASPVPVLPWTRPDRYGCAAATAALERLRLFSTQGELAA